MDELLKKREYYSQMILDLQSKDINAEVEIRLAEEKKRIAKEICNEIDADVIKCQHYIELLEMLIREKEKENEEIINSIEHDNTNIDTNESVDGAVIEQSNNVEVANGN